MTRSLLKTIGGIGLAFISVCSPAIAGDGDVGPEHKPSWLVTYSGVDFAKDSSYFYTGAIVSLNRDLSRSGLVLAAYSGYAAYQYDSTAVAGGKVDGDGIALSAMLGYLFVRPGAAVGLYAGLDYQNHDLTPKDPTSAVSGDEVGFRIGGDVRLTGPQHYASIEGYYSTAFDSYWSRARVGGNLGHIIIGPEALALGNAGFDAQRVGAFAMTKLHLNAHTPIELTVSGGYQFVNDQGSGSSGGEGAYGALNVTFVY